jgi:hypothetical protein
MAISHDLNSEIVAALLAAKERTPGELEDLKETLLTIHTTLQKLTDEEHAHAYSLARKSRKKAAAGSSQR